jgi:hypothetical protein
MSRVAGDRNRSIREHKVAAEKEALRAENKALKAKLKAKDLRIKELRERV